MAVKPYGVANFSKVDHSYANKKTSGKGGFFYL